MGFRDDCLIVILKGSHHLLEDGSSTCFSEFTEVSESLIDGYARFIRVGLPGETVAPAMLWATMNIYEMCGMLKNLPPVLRHFADRIENDSATH